MEGWKTNTNRIQGESYCGVTTHEHRYGYRETEVWIPVTKHGKHRGEHCQEPCLSVLKQRAHPLTQASHLPLVPHCCYGINLMWYTNSFASLLDSRHQSLPNLCANLIFQNVTGSSFLFVSSFIRACITPNYNSWTWFCLLPHQINTSLAAIILFFFLLLSVYLVPKNCEVLRTL